jgi:hypothetical protein
VPAIEEASRLRLRKFNGIDAKEVSQKAKKTKEKKVKPVFTQVCAASDDDTRGIQSECDESVVDEEKEDNAAHESDEDERPRKKR